MKYTIKMEDVTTQKQIKEKDEALKAAEGPQLDAYLKQNAPNAIKTDSGLYYVIEKDGTGSLPKAGDTIVHTIQEPC